MAKITQVGKDVLYSNSAFVEDAELKNSFKAAIKAAELNMHWDKDEKAFRITDAKTKQIAKIDKSHMEAKVEEKSPKKANYPVNQQGKDVTYSNPKFVEDAELKNSFKAAIKAAGYDMCWDKKQKLFVIENADKKDIIAIHKNHMNEKVEEKVAQNSAAKITQVGKDVLYSNSAFVEDAELKNSFKAAIKAAELNMHWDKDEKAFRITDAKTKQIAKIDKSHMEAKVEENPLQKLIDEANSTIDVTTEAINKLKRETAKWEQKQKSSNPKQG